MQLWKSFTSLTVSKLYLALVSADGSLILRMRVSVPNSNTIVTAFNSEKPTINIIKYHKKNDQWITEILDLSPYIVA